MFPSANVSFSLDIHITLLNFSGNSVAIGVSIMASIKAGIWRDVDIMFKELMNFSAPIIINAMAMIACNNTSIIKYLFLIIFLFFSAKYSSGISSSSSLRFSLTIFIIYSK